MTQPPQEITPALRNELQQRIPALLGWPAGPITLTPLPGDASNRSYFRISTGGDSPLPRTPIADGSHRHTAIVMLLADPEGFKASEEAVSSSARPVTELPFLNIWRHLDRHGLHVPQLHHYDQAGGWLLLEDTGDRLLSHAVQDQPPATVQALYRQAIEELIRLQTLASTPPDPQCLAFGRSFDDALFMWEFDHFVDYGIEARQGLTLTPAQRRAIDDAFRPVAAELAAQPRCLTHRDYHSRNLMLHRGQLWMIDFQDALMGPPHYDLASLLRDSYITLPGELIDTLIDDYLQLCEQNGRHVADRAAFRRLFDLASVQRNLKAAGRFVYIWKVKQNDRYLEAIPRTLGYVRANFRRYAELKPLRELLAPLVPELAA